MRVSDTMLILGSLALFFLLDGQGFPPHQEWSLKPSSRSGMVHFTVTRAAEGSRWQHSSDVPFSAFRGLPADQLDRLHTSAKFEYVRDAGRVVCEGSFSLGRGSGTFTFVPDPNFATELERLGYSRPTGEQVFSMMMSDVTLEFARGVRDAGLRASTSELIELRIHGVTLDYIHETRAAGYPDLAAKDLIELKIHGVTTAFLRDLKKAGYNLSAKDVIELRIHGVTSEFVAELKSAGYDLVAREITELRIHGMTEEYLRDLSAYGLKPAARDLVQMRIHGITPDYLKGLKDAGYENLAAPQIVELRVHGVSTDFVREAKAAGYSFTPKDLVELRIHGVNGAYLQKIKDAGFRNLSAQQIAKLKMHGID